MRGRFPLWGVLGLLVSVRAFGVGEMLSPLFVIEKSSQTRNVVHYDARLHPDGTFDPAQPVTLKVRISNGTGDWWYVNTAGPSGWVLEGELDALPQ